MGCQSGYCSLCVEGCLTLHPGTAQGCLMLHDFALAAQSHTSRSTSSAATPADMRCRYAIGPMEWCNSWPVILVTGILGGQPIAQLRNQAQRRRRRRRRVALTGQLSDEPRRVALQRAVHRTGTTLAQGVEHQPGGAVESRGQKAHRHCRDRPQSRRTAPAFVLRPDQGTRRMASQSPPLPI